MPQMYVPGVGDKIVLTHPWPTQIHHEYRNLDAISKFLGFEFNFHPGNAQTVEWLKIHAPAHYNHLSWRMNNPEVRWGHSDEERLAYDAWWKTNRRLAEAARDEVLAVPVTVPDGTLLTIDRVYVKKGLSEFNSVTFWALLPGEKKKLRFWCKLDDVNAGLIFRMATPEEADPKKKAKR